MDLLSHVNVGLGEDNMEDNNRAEHFMKTLVAE